MAYPYLDKYTMAKNGVSLVANSRLLIHPTDATPDIPPGGKPMRITFSFNGGNNIVAIGEFLMKDRYQTNGFIPTTRGLIGSEKSRYYDAGSSIVEDPPRWVDYTAEELGVFNSGGSVAVGCDFSTIVMENKFTPTYFRFVYKLAGGGRNDKFSASLWFNNQLIGHVENLMPTSSYQYCELVNQLGA